MAKLSFTELFGEKLLKGGGEEVDTAQALKGKTVGIYSSAHWCPPCRQFTPQLSKSYSEHLQNKGFEVVFVSSDQNQGAFDQYFGEMPWLAVPFGAGQRQSLGQKFDVSGIPSLILLDEGGRILTKDGREMVSKDPTGESFPWKGGVMQVPRGKTMEFATRKAKTWEALIRLTEFYQLGSEIPALVQIAVALYLLLQPCGLQAWLAKWLLADGLFHLLNNLWRCIGTRQSLWAADPELQAYLIHKERDGETDAAMEAKVKKSKRSVTGAAGPCPVLLLMVGILLYTCSTGVGCERLPCTAFVCCTCFRFITSCGLFCCGLGGVISLAKKDPTAFQGLAAAAVSGGP